DGTGGTYKPGSIPSVPSGVGGSAPKIAASLRSPEERKAILESAITLIQRAALQPGGSHFGEAVKKLNKYFEGTNLAEYQLESSAREYLRTQYPPALLNELESTKWTLRDARHLEDCLMYYGIATRVAKTGEDLTRVRRVFDWVVQQVELVPAGSLGS